MSASSRSFSSTVAAPLTLVTLALGVGFWSGCQQAPPEAMTFLRGNTHTHTLWSDGDAAPEWVAAWYRERDYDFLVLSEHNIVADHEKWFRIGDGRLPQTRVDELIEQFGAEAVEVRDRPDGEREMRLRTLDELRARFEAPGEFLMITGEEITDGFEGANVHVNALNVDAVIAPQHGTSLTETVANNVAAVQDRAIGTAQPMLAHLNHPNFTWSMGWEDFGGITGLRFFEVYNGHPSVRNLGDDTHPSTEAMWDFINTERARSGDALLLGVVTDDSHHYFEWGAGKSNPGRGWTQVAADSLDAPAVLSALEQGAFYGSSGVELHSFERTDSRYVVRVLPEEGVRYTIRFLGSRGDEVGAILAEIEGTEARYDFTGDELFVRAQVVSDRAHPNPAEAGEMESAWLQPLPGPAATR
jgi:histidinol phosphatase-like PHP family hydrolase